MDLRGRQKTDDEQTRYQLTLTGDYTHCADHLHSGRITGKPECAGVNRHVGVSKERLVYSVRRISPG